MQRVKNRKNEFVGDQHRTTASPILPPKTLILAQEAFKSMQILIILYMP